MTIRETQLLAWLDGELDEAGAEQVERAVQADPVLMARAEAHFLAMMQLRAAFAPLLETPFPNAPGVVEPAGENRAETDVDRAAADSSGSAFEFAPPSTVRARAIGLARPAIRRWSLLAAAVLLGVLIGRFILRSSAPTAASRIAGSAPAPGGLVRDEDGSLVAAGSLAATLENGLATNDTAPVRIPLSFRDKSGRLCRSFDTARLAGIACRDQDGWRLRLALQTNGSGRPASSESPFVGQAVDAMIAGNPLDAGEEQAARERGWR